MRIATLQFNPVLGAVDQNMNTATTLLESSSTVHPTDLDLLVLPELAFSGYNFSSLDHIRPYLEPTTAGPTTRWAVETAMRCDCYVLVGYPEVSTRDDDEPHNYNSLVVVSPEGRVLRNYRKSFLYYTDETWAVEGFDSSGSANGNGNGSGSTSTGEGQGSTVTPAPPSSSSTARSKTPFFCGDVGDLTGLGLGICMDINPYRFVAPWSDYEFATHMLDHRAKLVILSMAWITRLLPDEMAAEPDKPDMETVAYWLERFHPFVERAPEDEVIVVFANRCGTEGQTNSAIAIDSHDPVEQGDRVCYAGSSCIMRFQGGNVRMFEKRPNEVAVLGKGEEGLLFVDTAKVGGSAGLRCEDCLTLILTRSSLHDFYCHKRSCEHSSIPLFAMNQGHDGISHETWKDEAKKARTDQIRILRRGHNV